MEDEMGSDNIQLLTLYNEHHFFAPNELKGYSLSTKNKTLKTNRDGSLTLYLQAELPRRQHKRDNWVPAPGSDSSCICAPIGRGRRSSTDHGRRHPFSG
jgi:hypothetical protein